MSPDSTNVVLAQMSEPLEMTEHVNNLCLGPSPDVSLGCGIAGASHSSFSNNIFVDARPCEDESGDLCLTTFDQLTEEPINWSGEKLV